MQEVTVEFKQAVQTFRSACLAAKNEKDVFEASGKFWGTAKQIWTRKASQKLSPVQVQKFVEESLQEIDPCIKSIVDTTLELITLREKVTIH